MIVAVDIGNSNIVLGFWDEQKWISSDRFETHPIGSEQFGMKINHLLKTTSFNKTSVTNIIVSSVVPDATLPITKVLKNIFRIKPLVLDSTIDTGLQINRNHPEKVGTDLIASGVAAYHLIQDNCVVVDFGTATTVMVIEKPGVLAGGAICPGLQASKEALIGNAAQLVDVPMQPPASALAKTPAETIQSGLLFGHVAMVEGLVYRMKKKTDIAKVIATGGFSEMLAPLTDIFDIVNPLLTLDGLRLIVERQAADGKREM